METVVWNEVDNSAPTRQKQHSKTKQNKELKETEQKRRNDDNHKSPLQTANKLENAFT
jgi:hypothetical protein